MLGGDEEEIALARGTAAGEQAQVGELTIPAFFGDGGSVIICHVASSVGWEGKMVGWWDGGMVGW